ncbi:hypothetical protein BDY19DRAFT_999085 [Irpex rosettiformis]|uniref:Uncharacterized protein n=1 Tax=Irpex rosettiformis TaxID=378272 RepID=A0ACB8TLR7_9APHY|nr:hypothetical protein BDY19DRAFT_999085 [Irpex rosettiformis]
MASVDTEGTPYKSTLSTSSEHFPFSNVIQVIERADGDECKILHRDISIGNVMLSGKVGEDDVGLLEDWDHARVTISGEARERQKYRAGTWSFMSIGLLQNPKKAHEILDDFESMFWTKLYEALHRFKHTGEIDMGVFTENHPKMDAGYTASDMVVGGDRKYTTLAMFPLVVKFSCKPLQTLLRRIVRAIKDYYDAKYRLSGAEDIAANDSDEDQDDDLSEACEVFELQHAKLNDPKFWLNTFKSALDRKDWEDDLMSVDPYPIRTEEQETQQIESSVGKDFERKNQSGRSKVTDEDPTSSSSGRIPTRSSKPKKTPRFLLFLLRTTINAASTQMTMNQCWNKWAKSPVD